MSVAKPMSIHEQRALVRRLLNDSSAADAPTAYYALFYDPVRSVLFTRQDESGRVSGFVGRFQTGIDLFRPLVTLSCQNAEIAADLLAEALVPEHPYILFASLNQYPFMGGSFEIDHHRVLRIYRLDVRRFQPVINVLVKLNKAHDGTPRGVIESGGLRAVAGVNWQSPAFAELYVHTDSTARQRGWGESVASAVTQAVLEGGRTPLYLVESDNEPSRHLAEKLGYADTGARQVYADAVYLGYPGN
jgi:ribosomal protein S18 acetylase RimI-like enzyme